MLPGGQTESKLHIIELGAKPGATPFTKRTVDLFFPPDFADDFPVSMQVSDKFGFVYVVTKLGLLFVYDLETGAALYRNRISMESVFLTAERTSTGGFLVLTRGGKVLSVEVNSPALVPFITSTLQNPDLALAIASRCGLPGAEQLIQPRFEALFATGDYKAAAEMAAASPNGILRTRETIARFQGAPAAVGAQPPLLVYFRECLSRGKLNAFESFELAKLVVQQNKRPLLDTWMAEDKLECTEELGDMVFATGPDGAELALKVYVRARAHAKVAAALASAGQTEKLAAYCEQTGYTANVMDMLARTVAVNPAAALQLALSTTAKGGSPVSDINTVADMFLQRGMVREATSFLLEALKPNLAEHGALQTKVLEINLLQFPTVADAILAQGALTHYDAPRVAQLCEKAGLYSRALQHYTDLADIKRVVVNTHAIPPDALVEFFGSLRADWALECLHELLAVNARANLQVVVQIAKEYTEQLGGCDKVIQLLEQFKSYEGLFFYLSHFVNTSTDAEVHFKYIEAAARTNQAKELERVTRESTSFEPERVKVFLMEAKLADVRPLINVCDRFGFVADLTKHLYSANMLRYIEGYVQKVNPAATPGVVGALLDAEADEGFIKALILSVRSLLPVGPLVEEVERRNRLKLLQPFLEHLMHEGSQDPAVHNAMGKVIIDSNSNPEHFLSTNRHYDSLVLGKYCEKRDPHLACVAYKRGQCDLEFVDVTSRNSLFKVQARYVVERMSPDLWAAVLQESNPHRKALVDQVVSTALPESKNPDQVSVTVKAFMTASLQHELIELLEKIVLQNSAFSNNPNLQNLLILTAIKADKTRVMDYITRLDHFDGAAVGDIAIGSELYEEAFAIFKKFNNHLAAAKVLLDNMAALPRAAEYAAKVDIPEVWSALGKAQLAAGHVADAIASFIRAKDSADYSAVIDAAHNVGAYTELVTYLRMVRKKVKDVARVDTELAYALAFTGALAELEEFIGAGGSTAANLTSVGDRLFAEERYEAARILFTATSNWGRLASTFVRLRQWQPAVEVARKANAAKTWKEVCFACVDEKEFRLAQLCGLSIVVHADELDSALEYYTSRGYYEEGMQLLEAGVGLDRAHMGLFTELGILYALYKPEKLRDHLKLFATRLNTPKLIRVCEEQRHWRELAWLYRQYDEYDNAAITMMRHADAWDHVEFKETLVRVANAELYYRAAQFYLEERPQLLNDLLTSLTSRLDHGRVVLDMRKGGHLAMVKQYLQHVQKANLAAVNEALHDLYAEEEDLESLRSSVDLYDNFDQVGLAQRFERHDLVEFRRLAAYLYKRNGRAKAAVELCKRDGCFKDAIEIASTSGDKELADELLAFFVAHGQQDCFGAMLYSCYDLLRPDAVLETAWLNGMLEPAWPYLIQVLRDVTSRLDKLVDSHTEQRVTAAQQQQEAKQQEQQHNAYASLLPPALPAPADWAASHPAQYANYDPYHNGYGSGVQNGAGPYAAPPF